MQLNEIKYKGKLTPAAQKRIGVVALATDLTIERELPKMLPPGLEIFTNRVLNKNPLTLDNLRAMQGDITRAAAGILPGRGIHAAIYACTSGSAAIGFENVEKCIHAAHPGVPVSTPPAALDAACAALDIKKLSILTPYTADINRELAKLQTAAGREILNIDGLGFTDDCAIADIPPADIIRHAKDACRRGADALFISCTALRAAEVAEEIERGIGIPVFTSNQLLAWHARNLVQCKLPADGFGVLLRSAV